MRDRVDAFGVSEPELARTGKDQIEVNLPGVADAERAAKQVGSTAQLFFYDWEKNVLDENCKTNDTEIDGGQQPVTGLYNAVKRAAKCDIPVPKNSQAAADPRFYAFDKVTKKPFANGIPGESRAEALDGLTAAQKEKAEVIEVKPGVLVLRDEKPSPTAPDPDSFWIIRDNPGLSGTDIKNPEQNFDQQAGNEPNVTFDFSRQGPQGVPEDHRARSPSAAPTTPTRSTPTRAELAALRDRAGQRARLDPADQLPREPGRHRRLDRRPDLRRLHDHERAGPREDPQDRRAAAAARADLALAGLRHARQAGAQPGPQGGRSPAS